MISKIKEYFEGLNAEKQMKKKYLEDEKRYYFENKPCMNCKFLTHCEYIDGTLACFKCKITGKHTHWNASGFPNKECEYFACARIHGKGNKNEL